MKNIIFFLSENFHFLVVKFSIYLNRHVFVIIDIKQQMNDTAGTMQNQTNHSDSVVTLDQWNKQLVEMLIPFIVILVFYLIMGVIGNSTVIYINNYKITKTCSGNRFFISVLAVVDMISCVVNCSCHLSEVALPVMYNSDIGCKIERYLCMTTTGTSIFILLLIAIYRYIKICKPFGRQMTAKWRKICIIVSVIFVVIISTPCFYFFGSRVVYSNDGSITGQRCTGVNAGMPFVALAFNISLMLIVVAVLVVMSVLYIRICGVIFRMSKFNVNVEIPPANTTSENDIHGRTDGQNIRVDASSLCTNTFNNTEELDLTACTKEQNVGASVSVFSNTSDNTEALSYITVNTKDKNVGAPVSVMSTKPHDNKASPDNIAYTEEQNVDADISTVSNNESNSNEQLDSTAYTEEPNVNGVVLSISTITTNADDTKKSFSYTDYSRPRKQPSPAKRKVPGWRTTFMFIIITIAFVVSFIPKLVMMILESANSDFWVTLSDQQLCGYMFLYSVYIFNNFLNPFIYGFMDKKFQFELKNCCCRPK